MAGRAGGQWGERTGRRAGGRVDLQQGFWRDAPGNRSGIGSLQIRERFVCWYSNKFREKFGQIKTRFSDKSGQVQIGCVRISPNITRQVQIGPNLVSRIGPDRPRQVQIGFRWVSDRTGQVSDRVYPDSPDRTGQVSDRSNTPCQIGPDRFLIDFKWPDTRPSSMFIQ